MFSWNFESALPGVAWPAVPGGEAAAVAALLWQLEQSQRLDPAQLRELQLRQAERLAHHAFTTVPYYRERRSGSYDPAQPLTMEHFRGLPLLRRADVLRHHDAMVSTSIPPAHGATHESVTTGSTGMPVRVLKTGLIALMWKAITLRDHAWHARDLGGKLAAVRYGRGTGRADSWGAATAGIVATGRSAVLSLEHDVDAQLRWLQAEQPQYLMTYPSNLAELARSAREKGIALPSLREVRTFGEMLQTDVRDLCRLAWGAKLTDLYSCDEAGYLALQCPEHQHYHVQSESVLLEVLDEHGFECAPGEVGRVVVTDLHNFAMPLIRYELQDYAEAGAPCPCGRGLPVLTRVMGRVRNMLVTREGRRYWPTFGTRDLEALAPVVQSQFVQKEIDLVEARLVVSQPVTAQREEAIRRHVLAHLPEGFRLQVSYRDAIPRSAGGKFEDFYSELPPRPDA